MSELDAPSVSIVRLPLDQLDYKGLRRCAKVASSTAHPHHMTSR